MFCLCLSIHPAVSQSINQSVRPSAMSVCSFVGLTVRPSLHPSIHPAFHPSLLSICLYIFSFDRPLVKAHYFFTDSLIGPGHLHRKKHTEPSFCVLSVFVHPSRRQSINQSICPTVRHVCLFVRGSDRPSVRPSIHPFIQPSIHPYCLSVCIFFHLTDR